MSTIQIGDTTILGANDSGNSTTIQSQLAVLSQNATIQTISYYIATAAGNIRCAIYDATGAGGGPGQLKAETASTVAVGPNTWNDLPVLVQVLLTAGNYWLAWQNSSGSLVNRWSSTGGTNRQDNGTTYGPFPATFTIDGSGSAHWSIFATLDTGAAAGVVYSGMGMQGYGR